MSSVDYEEPRDIGAMYLKSRTIHKTVFFNDPDLTSAFKII